MIESLVGMALIVLGVAFGLASVAQCFGFMWFLFNKPVVQPSPEKLVAGGIFGLVMAATAVLVGVKLVPGDLLGGNVGLVIYVTFMASCVVVTAVLWVRRHRGPAPLS